MKRLTETLLTKVDQSHDWTDEQIRGGSGTQLTTSDSCRVCGLTRRCFSDSQNGISKRYTFGDRTGELTLAEAALLKCCGED
jgi:hypothetical protein